MPRVGNTSIKYPSKPPRYWINAKLSSGITAPGAGRIWWRIYTEQKRITAWMAAPEEEWIEHDCHRPL